MPLQNIEKPRPWFVPPPAGLPPRAARRDPITEALSPQLNDAPMFGGQSTDQLGGQMMSQMAPQQLAEAPQIAAKKPGVLDKGGIGWTVLGILGDALSGYGGQQGSFGPAMAKKAEGEREDNRFQQQLEAARQARMAPRVEQVGNTIGFLDPSAGKYNPFFTAPSPAEQYASARGYAAGTPDYQTEVENYRLGTWSDPAMENRSGLDAQRFDQRRELLGDRLDVTRRGQDMTDGRVRDSAGFKGKASATGRTATDPSTGKRLRELGDGRWVPIQ